MSRTMCVGARRWATARAADGRSGALLLHRPGRLVALALGLWGGACGGSERAEALPGGGGAQTRETVRPGIEVLLSDSLHLVAGRRVGLITNHTGIDREGRSDIDLLFEHSAVELVALYAPEHGIRGDEQDGVIIASDVDERTGLPIHSLYGATRTPTPAMLVGIDVLLFDMQDIGARYYTYVSTLALAMETAGENGIPFVVLDRPNPIRGDVVQGNVLDPAFSTFVGMFPVPMRHGMTPGELARLYVAEFGIDVELSVVQVAGWSRALPFDETELPWVAPSPNMPSLESALAYAGTCLFEGTNLSVGRGTDRAFQWIGAPWLDAERVVAALAAYDFDGVRFEATTFVPRAPSDAKYDGQEVPAVRLVGESSTYDAPRVAVAMLVEIRRAHPEEWGWLGTIDRLAGTDSLRLGIDTGLSMDELTGGWDAAVAAFEALRAPHLLYR
ncbi:MAG TPA: DUF1343 domain-containing protein [Longimicrobiales bacterium]|nr:DUF1343 domain-containing protein [Longimicrobiales bacterium]